jgi:hypothetical protein
MAASEMKVTSNKINPEDANALKQDSDESNFD